MQGIREEAQAVAWQQWAPPQRGPATRLGKIASPPELLPVALAVLYGPPPAESYGLGAYNLWLFYATLLDRGGPLPRTLAAAAAALLWCILPRSLVLVLDTLSPPPIPPLARRPPAFVLLRYLLRPLVSILLAAYGGAVNPNFIICLQEVARYPSVY